MDFEINATREVFPVVQFGNQIDVVFPKLVVRPDVHCAGVILSLIHISAKLENSSKMRLMYCVSVSQSGI